MSEPTLISAPLDLCFLVQRQKRNVAAHTADTFIRTGPNKSHMVRVWIRFRLVLVHGMTRLHLRWTRPVQILLCGLGLGKVHHFHVLTYSWLLTTIWTQTFVSGCKVLWVMTHPSSLYQTLLSLYSTALEGSFKKQSWRWNYKRQT